MPQTDRTRVAGKAKEAARKARAARKWRDAAAVLTALGVIIFASPLISAVASGDGDRAVPLAVQYVFNTWAALIVAAFFLARLLTRPDPETDGATSADAPQPDEQPLR